MTGWPLHTYRKPIASNAICMTCNLCFLEPERTVHKFILIRDLAFLLNLTGLFVRELALRVSPATEVSLSPSLQDDVASSGADRVLPCHSTTRIALRLHAFQ